MIDYLISVVYKLFVWCVYRTLNWFDVAIDSLRTDANLGVKRVVHVCIKYFVLAASYELHDIVSIHVFFLFSIINAFEVLQVI